MYKKQKVSFVYLNKTVIGSDQSIITVRTTNFLSVLNLRVSPCCETFKPPDTKDPFPSKLLAHENIALRLTREWINPQNNMALLIHNSQSYPLFLYGIKVA